MKVKVSDYCVQKNRNKWGSCKIELNRLWFNVELAKKPIREIEFVVVHEMVHLLERRHSGRFEKLMNKYFPDWKKRKVGLNKMLKA